MKKFYSLIVASALTTAAFAQCSVSPLANLTVLNPLPTNDLPSGSVGLPYNGSGVSITFAASGQPIDPATLAVLIPNLSLPIPAGLASFSVTRVQVTGVSGLPAGLTAVSSDTPADWSSDAGCYLISGTPTTAGSYDITFNTILTIHYVVTLGGQSGDFTSPEAPVKYTTVVNNNASITEFSAAGFNLFPNPATENFSISYPSTNADMATIEVTDLSGKVVYVANKSINAQGGSIQISTDGLANGMYHVTFKAGDIRTASKLVVRN